MSRESFRHALRGGRSCLVVPGGQAEMLQSQSNDMEVMFDVFCQEYRQYYMTKYSFSLLQLL